MAQEYRPGEIVPQSGIYTITHDPAHAEMSHEVTAIKGRRFPTCRHCKGVRFELSHAAKHVDEIDHLEEARAGHARRRLRPAKLAGRTDVLAFSTQPLAKRRLPERL